MNVYNFHTQTGEYLGVSKADENPLEAGKFLIPACATTLAPLKPGDNEVAMFNGEKWQLTPDHRGVEYWLDDGSHHTIVELGQTVPEAALLEPLKVQDLSRREGEFRDFMKLFTNQEQLKIVAATQDNPEIKLWYDKAMGGTRFSLDHPETTEGLRALVDAGLIAISRVAEILESDFSPNT